MVLYGYYRDCISALAWPASGMLVSAKSWNSLVMALPTWRVMAAE